MHACMFVEPPASQIIHTRARALRTHRDELCCHRPGTRDESVTHKHFQSKACIGWQHTRCMRSGVAQVSVHDAVPLETG